MAKAKPKAVSTLNRAELEKLAKKEGVEIEEGMTVPDIRNAIRTHRGEGTSADGDTEVEEGNGKNVDTGGDGPQNKVEGQDEVQTEGDETVPQDVKTIPTSTDAERKARSGGSDDPMGLPSGEGKEIPKSEIPPTSGPEDVMWSGEDYAGRAEPYTGEKVPANETLMDGGPQPPQPTGADEPARPLDQTAAPGFKTEGQVAAAEAERRGAAEAADERRRTRREERPLNPSVSINGPKQVNSQLEITGRGFRPGAPVKVELSDSRTATGQTGLRADPNGMVQVTIMPVPGEQSVTLKSAEGEATLDFRVKDTPDREREREQRERAKREEE